MIITSLNAEITPGTNVIADEALFNPSLKITKNGMNEIVLQIALEVNTDVEVTLDNGVHYFQLNGGVPLAANSIYRFRFILTQENDFNIITKANSQVKLLTVQEVPPTYK